MAKKTRSLIAIIYAVLATLSTQGLQAIPAYPGLINVHQPDGSELQIQKFGDEHGFILLTSDNVPLVRTAEKWYEYATPVNDMLVASGIPASAPDRRMPQEIDWISNHKITLDMPVVSNSLKGMNRKSAPAKIKINDFPTVGRQKTLVLLVEFENCSFSTIADPYAYYNGMLNEVGFTHANGANGSARDYFLESSFGQFDPNFVVVGPVKVSHPYEYYGENSYEALDANVAEMVKEACSLVDSQVDFSEFDADGNGYVDNVYIFYAGYGEADSNDFDSIWPHSGYLEDNWHTTLSLDGIKINNYTCSNEIRFDSAPDLQPVGIGTFVHEFGHVLGLADHYDTLYTSGRSGVNEWDTMAAASYHDNQNTPPLYSAFERAELGWLEYTGLAPDYPGNLYIPDLADTNKAYRIEVDGTSGREYFILESRRQSGWDRTLPGNGLLVWHIDMDDEAWQSNLVNVDARHQRVDIVEADRIENATTYSSDPFPGSMNVRQFVFNGWDSREIFGFDNVLQLDDQVKVLLSNTDFIPDCPEYVISDVHGKSFTVTVTDSRDADLSVLTVSDSNGIALDMYENVGMEGNGSIKIESLEPNSDYTVTVYGKVGSYLSDKSVTHVATGEVEFFEILPSAPSIKEISDDALTLMWNPIEDADKYTINAYLIDWDTTERMESDFSDGLSEIPDGWVSSSSTISKSTFGKTSPALRLDKDGDYLLFNCEGKRPSTLEFFSQSQSASNMLIVEHYDRETDSWIETRKIEGDIKGSVSCIETEGQVIRIRFVKKAGYVILDDVVLTVSIETRTPILGGNIDAGQATEYHFSGLIPDLEYGFIITAHNNGVASLPSESLIVRMGHYMGIMESLNSSEEDDALYFDLYGNRVSRIDSFHNSIIIKRYADGHAVKIMR